MTKNISRWKLLGLLVTAPIWGAVYCMFLPFIGIYLVGKLGVEKMRKRAKRLVTFCAGVV